VAAPLIMGPTKIRGLGRFPEGWVPLTKQVFEFVVEHPCPDLKQEVSPARGPPHRLLLDEPLADHLIDGGFDEARRDALPVQYSSKAYQCPFTVLTYCLHG